MTRHARSSEDHRSDRHAERRHVRRSQSERRAQTRQALLDATVDCLVDRGYRRTTTSDIARRAKVSVGALQHHFDSKTDLLTAAIEHVLERRLDEFAKAMADRAPEADDFDAAIDILWGLMSGPTFTAWLELSVAGRTDRHLGPAMAATDERFAEAAHVQFAEWFGHVPGLTDAEERAAVLDLTFALLDGLSLRRMAGGAPEEAARVLDRLKGLSRLVYPRSQPSPDATRSTA